MGREVLYWEVSCSGLPLIRQPLENVAIRGVASFQGSRLEGVDCNALYQRLPCSVMFLFLQKLSNAVKECFVRLHEEGTIYRSNRLVNSLVHHTQVCHLEHWGELQGVLLGGGVGLHPHLRIPVPRQCTPHIPIPGSLFQDRIASTTIPLFEVL